LPSNNPNLPNDLYVGGVPGYENVPADQQPVFRRGRPEDAQEAAALVYAAGPEEFRFVLSISHHQQALEFLEWVWAEGGQFGYDDHLCIDVGGKVVAVGTARTAASTRKLFFKSMRQIFSFYTFPAALKVSWNGLRTESNVPPAQPGQRYIADIAVSPKFRGQGLAQALVSRLMTFFPDENLTSTLHVNVENGNARRLYERLGFEEAELCTSTLRSNFGHIGGHWKMEVKL
jgi:ribosomal protein S18 acetylase RimI-like enzyme